MYFTQYLTMETSKTNLCLHDGSLWRSVSRHLPHTRYHIQVARDRGRHGVAGETEEQLLLAVVGQRSKRGWFTATQTFESLSSVCNIE